MPRFRTIDIALIVLLFVVFGCFPKSAKKDILIDTTRVLAEEVSVKHHFFSTFIMKGSNWDVTVDTLEEDEFHSEKKFPYVEQKVNSDSLMASIVEKFPHVITITDSCCVVHSIDRDIELCKRRPTDDKGWTDYVAYGLKDDYLIILDLWYEGGVYLIFNLLTRECSSTQNEPIFVSDEIVYAAGSYYGEGQFEIVNLKNGKNFGFDTGWNLTGHYSEGKSIYLEFSSMDERKYLRVNY